MRVQAVNDMGSLVFLVFLLTVAVLTVILIYHKLRGRKIRSFAFAIPLCLCTYAVTLIGISLRSETRTLAPGAEKCFDDWCATVTEARSLPHDKGAGGTKLLAVTLRISNRARRAVFRPSQPRVMLVLSAGELVTPLATAQRELEKQVGPQEDMAQRLDAGESFQTNLAFAVPTATRKASVVVLEGPAILTRILVGDENSFFHRKTVYPITVD